MVIYRKVGNQWALDEAKRNLVLKYMLVGVTELMEDFIAVLEATMPVMFDGLSENFRQGWLKQIVLFLTRYNIDRFIKISFSATVYVDEEM